MMKGTTILVAVMVTMVAGGAMAQNNTTGPGSQPLMMPGALSACQQQVYLNRYRLMGWSGVVPDRYVGAAREKVGTEARLKELKDDYVDACAADGNEMMAATRKIMQDRHNRRMAEFDDFWGAWARRWVVDVHNGNLGKMTEWYQEGIRNCRQHFTTEFDALHRTLCR